IQLLDQTRLQIAGEAAHGHQITVGPVWIKPPASTRRKRPRPRPPAPQTMLRRARGASFLCVPGSRLATGPGRMPAYSVFGPDRAATGPELVRPFPAALPPPTHPRRDRCVVTG